MNCPECGTEMVPITNQDVHFARCPGCGGVWLDPAAISALGAAVPMAAETHPQPTRFEDRGEGGHAGRGVPFGGAHSRVKPEAEAPSSRVEQILKG